MKRKIIVWGLLIILVLGLAGGGGYAGYRYYVSLRQGRLVKQAREHLANSEPKKALLCLQRALKSNSRDPEACRLMAELTEAARSPSALLWRGRVVELDPHSLSDRLALAQTAMMLRDYATATNALDGVDEAGKKTARYHNIAGTVAAAANQPAQATAHFMEAARLEPQNPVLQLNLAVIRLRGTNASVLGEARSSLKQISANPTNSQLRCEALRELTIDAVRFKQADAALALTTKLLQETNSVFRDRLLRLEVLRETRSPEFKPALAGFQREAATNAGKIHELGMWQMTRTTPRETLAWLLTLPAGTQSEQPAALLVAECYTILRDWRGLQAFVEQQNWAELEFVRHAFKSLALRGQQLTSGSKAEWELALKAANNQKASLAMLLRLAAAWNWQSEAEELLWSIVNRYPDEKWASQALAQTLYAGGRTRPLMMLYTQEVKRSPSDPAMKNNLAMTALLLDAKELKPHDLARAVYQTAPTNAAYASTYAFSLYMQEKSAEALKVFQTLKPKDLEDPAVAGYYGLILKATGSKEKARVYLDWAFKGSMLPEERKLFERARAGA